MTTNQHQSDDPKLKLEALKFYRSEISLEFSLLGQRVSWFVMVQSFLITALAISSGYKTEQFNWLAKVVLPLIGMITSIVIIPGIEGASKTIDLWVDKYRKLLHDYHTLFEDFMTIRDQYDFSNDKIHTRSHYFAKYLPWLTFLMWVGIMSLSLLIPINII